MAEHSLPQKKGKDKSSFGDIAPNFARLTENVVFGELWSQPDLAPRDRSLATISALVALYRPDQTKSHILRGLSNGLTESEIAEAITHLAFYAGWPSAVSALNIARLCFQEHAGSDAA
jgi:4-carboxymuconolactone decarboxylase